MLTQQVAQTFAVNVISLRDNASVAVHEYVMRNVLECEGKCDDVVEAAVESPMEPGHGKTLLPEAAHALVTGIEGQTDNGESSWREFLVNVLQFGQGLHAGRTPGSPEIHEIHFPLKGFAGNEARGVVQRAEDKRRGFGLRPERDNSNADQSKEQ